MDLAGRPASLVATCESWVRAHHVDTAVRGPCGELTLSWTEPAQPDAAGDASCRSRGLAVDRLCRVLRLTAHTVQRIAVGAPEDGIDYTSLPDAEVFLEGLTDASGIGVDADDRLYLADRSRRTVTVFDLWGRRVLRTIHLVGAPVGLAVHGRTAWVVTTGPDQLVRLRLHHEPVSKALTPPGDGGVSPAPVPARVAVLPDGRPVVLWHGPQGGGLLVVVPRPGDPAGSGPAPLAVGGVADLVVDRDGVLVLAPCPGTGALLRRVALVAGDWVRDDPLEARGDEGSGLAVLRDGRVLHWTARGPRVAVRGRVTYRREGTTITYRLDSGQPRNRWGRLFLEACLPVGTDVRVATVTSDEDDRTRAITAAAAEPAGCPVPDVPSALTPPAPPPELVGDADPLPLHRRRDASTPWWRPDAEDHFDILEAPVAAPPGRYLWVTLHLTGDSRRTPIIREVRVERIHHRLVERLPRVFGEVTGGPAGSSDGSPAFLDRFLAMVDGTLTDLDLRSATRDVLLDPHATPVEALDWLAGFLGLVLDPRWAEAARRQLISEVVWLFRRRGTVAALSRYLALFLAGERASDAAGVVPVIVEHYRLRGIGPLLGDNPTVTSRSVLGAGFRVGGQVGAPGESPIPLDGAEATSTFASHAHRFTVLIPRPLVGEEEAAVRQVLDTERPAHTAYELCTLDAGMRVGRGLHLGLSTIVGPTGGFTPLVTDASRLGRDGLLGGRASGVPLSGGAVGRSRLS